MLEKSLDRGYNHTFHTALRSANGITEIKLMLVNSIQSLGHAGPTADRYAPVARWILSRTRNEQLQ